MHNDRIWIALGKTGDVLSVLPILYQEHLRTKSNPKLLISQQFAPILNGVSYVDPMVYPGHFSDLYGAIRTVKAIGKSAHLLQVYGKDFPIQHKTPSFQLDQWLRAGAAEHFCDWPLVIDRRNASRERALLKSVTKKRPFILLSDFGESSPFAHKEELATAMKDMFADTHDLLRLSEIRAESIYDLIGLYNKASLMVTIETAHLHLSRASTTPIIGLTTDNPSRWHGSAWHPRFIFNCRYGDFQYRKSELLHSAKNALNGNKAVEIEDAPTEYPFGYNPAIVENSPIMVYRFHPNEDDWRTNLAVFDGKKTTILNLPSNYSEYSHEDPRLFWFKGKLHIAITIARFENNWWNCVMAYGELKQTVAGWNVPKLFIPKYGKNDWVSREKNWMFFERNGRLYSLYASKNEQIILEIENEKVVRIHKSEGYGWPYGEIHGGCLTVWGDKYLRLFHSHSVSGSRGGWVYFIGAARMDMDPPFKTVAISSLPIISGNEHWQPGCFHWKQNVVISGGVQREGDGFRFAYGYNDCACKIAHLTAKQLHL